MNKRNLLVSIFMVVSLAFVVAATSSAVALSPSGPVGDQVFYSPYVESVIHPGLTGFVPTKGLVNQVFYSPFVGSIVKPGARSTFPKASIVSNQVFYSPFVGNIIKRSFQIGITNQVFYSPTIEGFVH